VETYDPFWPERSTVPRKLFDCVFSFEVLEHALDPRQTLEQICALLKPDGICFFSTLAQPPDIDDMGVDWWYVAPRNGHISLYSLESLEFLAQHVGLTLKNLDMNLHALYRIVPGFARHLISTRA
jgi:2-polyprenyl-6-hydroxyphenyl methylase/3-demethylubiquinone-9 3-methyltransferase